MLTSFWWGVGISKGLPHNSSIKWVTWFFFFFTWTTPFPIKGVDPFYIQVVSPFWAPYLLWIDFLWNTPKVSEVTEYDSLKLNPFFSPQSIFFDSTSKFCDMTRLVSARNRKHTDGTLRTKPKGILGHMLYVLALNVRTYRVCCTSWHWKVVLSCVASYPGYLCCIRGLV